MNGHKDEIRHFMIGAEHFIIPFFQRPYSWKKEQCGTLLQDMLDLSEERRNNVKSDATHFIGSIVCKLVRGDVSGFLIIDGQQRLITMFLFYLALADIAGEFESQDEDLCGLQNEIEGKLLIEARFGGKRSIKHHRFKLTNQDQIAMDKLFDKQDLDQESLLTKNYLFFYKSLNELYKNDPSILWNLYDITQYLEFIEISLDAAGDDPQLIFESLNSKGMRLSEGDKIRNFLFMELPQTEAEDYYNKYWIPIEENCKERLDDFIWYYLGIKIGKSPAKSSVYVSFKKIAANCPDKIELLKEIKFYSKLFCNIQAGVYDLSNCDSDLSDKERKKLQQDIEQQLIRSKFLGLTTRIPFVMQCMWLHQHDLIKGKDLLKSLELLETFLFRRWVCNPTNKQLNRLFQSKASALVNANSVIESLYDSLWQDMCANPNENTTISMPNDEEFKNALYEMDIYSKGDKAKHAIIYLCARLESSYNSSEHIKVFAELKENSKAYTCEHVMPQKLNKTWESELGSNAKSIHQKWLHRLGNLTITACNSKYGSKPFAEKCNMPSGYSQSPLQLNRNIAAYEHWSEKEIEQRAQELIQKALEVWPYPKKPC